MPNKVGGKNYKKSKHATDEPILYEVLPGQMYARVVKLVGGCNALVYCNDGKERICHIRGNMRKKVWIDKGDIVLVSLREFDESTRPSDIDRGDICAKYDTRVIQRLQAKDKSINPRLFINIENTDAAGTKPVPIPDEDDMDGFVFDRTGNEIVEDEESDSDAPITTSRIAQRKAMKEQEEDDVDIDNI